MYDLNILIIGCGSIGRRHIKNLKKIGIKQIIATDPVEKNLLRVKREFNILTRYTNHLDALKENKIDVAMICTPTSLHVPIAIDAINHGSHVFIEKPLSNNMERISELFSLANNTHKHVAIGFNLRFHPNLLKIKNLLDSNFIGKPLSVQIEVGQYLPDWHPDQDYRKEYSALKHLGGGVLLDATHELDYAQILFGKANWVFCIADKISDLEINTEDIAEILIVFDSGVLCSIHMDYLQRSYSRSCKIICENGTIWWDFKNSIVKTYSANVDKWESHQEIDFDYNVTYMQEIINFLNCISEAKKPLYSNESNLMHMKLVTAIKKSSSERKVVNI